MSIKDDRYIRTLSASLSPLPEYDAEEDTENIEIDPELEADMIDVINNIGTDEFKSLYLMVNYSFKHTDLDTQVRFCSDIMNKITEVYNFVSPSTMYYNSMDDINNVYEFLEFLEFKNSLFIQILLDGIITSDPRGMDIGTILDENWDRLSNRLINITKRLTNPIINSFLTVNTKDNLIRFFNRLIDKNMLDVVIHFLKIKI